MMVSRKSEEKSPSIKHAALFDGIASIRFMYHSGADSSSSSTKKKEANWLTDIFFDAPLGYFYHTQEQAEAAAKMLTDQYGISKRVIHQQEDYFIFKLSSRKFNRCFGDAKNTYSKLMEFQYKAHWFTNEKWASYCAKKK